MTEIIKQLAEHWAGQGAWALLTTLVAVTIATLIAKGLDARWKHHYDRDTERFKAQIEQNHLILTTAMSSLTSAAAAANPKVVEAVETIWKAIIRLRDESYAAGFYADITTKEEWCNLPSHPRQKEQVKAIAEAAEKRHHLLKELAAAEQVRPFVGELIWSMYFVYRALVLRVAVIVERDFSKGKLAYWYEDSGIQEFLRLLLTEEEIAAINQYDVSRFKQITAFAENRILREINRIISGHQSADSGLEHARKILRTVGEVEAGRAPHR